MFYCMFFELISNLNLLLPNYNIQSSINYIINITENIYTASIAPVKHVPRVWIFWSLKSRASQALYCTKLQTVCHCFNIYASIPVYVALML